MEKQALLWFWSFYVLLSFWGFGAVSVYFLFGSCCALSYCMVVLCCWGLCRWGLVKTEKKERKRKKGKRRRGPVHICNGVVRRLAEQSWRYRAGGPSGAICPSLLPAIRSGTLILGIKKIKRRKALYQRLNSSGLPRNHH